MTRVRHAPSEQKTFAPFDAAGMTAADMAELCIRIREPSVAKTLRCVRMGPPFDNGGALPDGLVSDGLVPLLSGPRRLEVRRVDSLCLSTHQHRVQHVKTMCHCKAAFTLSTVQVCLLQGDAAYCRPGCAWT